MLDVIFWAELMEGQCSKCEKLHWVKRRDLALNRNICLSCHCGIKPPDSIVKQMEEIIGCK